MKPTDADALLKRKAFNDEFYSDLNVNKPND